MKHNQHKSKHLRTKYETVRGNPMFGQGSFLMSLGTISAKEAHENEMPNYTKLNKGNK